MEQLDLTRSGSHSQGFLGLHAIVESTFSVSPSPSTNPLFQFFDNKDYADTLFLVHTVEENTPIPLLACKAMLVSASSHFKTRKSASLSVISLTHLRYLYP